VTDSHGRNVADSDRDAADACEQNVRNLRERGDDADAFQNLRLPALLQSASTDVHVVLAKRALHVLKGEPVFSEQRGIDLHVVLLLESAPSVHFRHARHCPELRLDDPVLQCAQLREVRLVGHALRSRPREQVVVNLSQARRHGPKLRLSERRGKLDVLEALPDQLAGEVDVDLVLEGQRDL
jgi:hypothetical protein